MHNKNFRDQVVTASKLISADMIVEPFDTLECAFQAALDIFARPSQRELDRRLVEAMDKHHHATLAYNLRQGADRAKLPRRREWRIDSLVEHNPPNDAPAAAPRARKRKAKPAAAAKPRAKVKAKSADRKKVRK